MKNIFLKKKILSKIVLVCICVMLMNSSTAADLTNQNVIKLGNWSLENAFSLCYGEGKTTTYTYSDIQKLYNASCINKQINELVLENNDLQFQQYNLQYESICDSITEYKQLVSQYTDLAKNYETEMNTSTGDEKDKAQQNMQNNILLAKTYEAELASAILKKAEIYVNRENCLFIKNNTTILKNQQYVSQKIDLRNSIYELKLLREKYDLQGTYAEYAKLQENEQSINKSKDMAFQVDVDIFSSDYDYYINQQDLVKNQFDNQFEQLLSNAGISTKEGVVINNKDIKSIQDEPFISYEALEDSNLNDIKKMQLKDKYRIIDGKIEILKEHYSDTSNEVKLAQNEKTQLSLEYNNWITQRKNILKYSHLLYRSKYNEISINERKARAEHDKYIILLNKFNFGLIDKLTVKKAELSYMQSNFNLWNTIYEFAITYSNIEKCLSGKIE